MHISPEARVNVENGGAFQVNNGQVLVENTGLVEISGGVFNTKNQSQIIIKRGGICRFSGGMINLMDQSQIIVQSGGTLEIINGTQNLLNSSKIVVEEGGVLNVFGLSDVNLKNSSNIVIEDKGRMNLKSSNSSNLAITFNGDNQGNAAIQVKGTLSTDLIILMFKKVFFQFYPTNKVEANTITLNILGDNLNKVNSSKLIELMPNTKLTIPSNVNSFIGRGIAYYHNNTAIQVAPLKNATFENMGFEGSPTGFGVKAITTGNAAVSYPKTVTIGDCYFLNCNH